MKHICLHDACGYETEVDHDLVHDGLEVTCVGCGRQGHFYIEADDEGFPYSGVTWSKKLTEGQYEILGHLTRYSGWCRNVVHDLTIVDQLAALDLVVVYEDTSDYMITDAGRKALVP